MPEDEGPARGAGGRETAAVRGRHSYRKLNYSGSGQQPAERRHVSKERGRQLN